MLASPPRLLTCTVILLGLVSVIVPVTEPSGLSLMVTPPGPAAGSGVIVAPGIPRTASSDWYVISAVPWIWSIVAPVKPELRCTPVAVALMLEIVTLFSTTLLALMSTFLRSCAAIWVRKGNPSIVTDGLADRFAWDW